MLKNDLPNDQEIAEIYRSLINDSPMRVVISNADTGQVVNVSNSLMDEGFALSSAEDAVGKSVVELGIWESGAERLEFIKMLRREGSRFRRVDYVDKLGKPHTQYRFSKLIKQGAEEYAIGVAMEVDELRQAEEKLIAYAARLEKAQEMAGVGDYLYNLSTATISGSKNFFKLLMVSESQVGITISDAFIRFDGPDRTKILEHFAGLNLASNADFNPEADFDFEVSLVVSQNTRYLKITAEKASIGDVVIHGIVQDVTEQRVQELERSSVNEKMQEAQKLESLGILAGGVAHDFNNLLSGIMGNADLAKLDIDDAEIVSQRLSDIIKASKSAADLTHQLLAYSGKGRFIVQPVDLSNIVKDMSQLLEISSTGKAVIQYNLAGGLPSTQADETQIKQIVMNLILNAVEAVDSESGRVHITTGAQYCDQSYLDSRWIKFDIEPGEYVFVEVSDNGVGMTEETRARLFEPFYTTKFTGRGLGMSAVQGIVKGHSGAIILYSEPGSGTTFKVLLPSNKEKLEKMAKSVSSKYHDGNQQMILVIDDDEEVRNTIKHVLSRHGYVAALAENGEVGIQLFEQFKDELRLVLIDLTMPGIGGSEVFRQMRTFSTDVPAILMSGYNEQDATQHLVGRGLAGFLPKPFMIDQLMSKVEEALKNRGGQKQSI
ncbi:MAG: signal transduction histidine kinase/CheY-like chemotaxis protein [Candidatus Azotimanducaceae bacterium]|jgi:signal transduction histidine kinase/CheY-like chemotaxis protein